MGTVRPGNRSFALIGDSDKQLTASTGFAVLSPKSDEYREYLYIAVTSDSNIERLAQLADGAAYPAVRPDVVARTRCVLPGESVIRRFSAMTQAVFQLRNSNLVQAQVLADCRDALLPILLSGEISLDDGRSISEAVL